MNNVSHSLEKGQRMTTSSTRNVLGAALLALLLAGVFACDQDILSGEAAATQSESGSLLISLGSVSGSNSVSEADDGTAAYVISGSGPDRQKFEVQSSEATVQVDDLSPGTWMLTADAAGGALRLNLRFPLKAEGNGPRAPQLAVVSGQFPHVSRMRHYPSFRPSG